MEKIWKTHYYFFNLWEAEFSKAGKKLSHLYRLRENAMLNPCNVFLTVENIEVLLEYWNNERDRFNKKSLDELEKINKILDKLLCKNK